MAFNQLADFLDMFPLFGLVKIGFGIGTPCGGSNGVALQASDCFNLIGDDATKKKFSDAFDVLVKLSEVLPSIKSLISGFVNTDMNNKVKVYFYAKDNIADHKNSTNSDEKWAAKQAKALLEGSCIDGFTSKDIDKSWYFVLDKATVNGFGSSSSYMGVFYVPTLILDEMSHVGTNLKDKTHHKRLYNTLYNELENNESGFGTSFNSSHYHDLLNYFRQNSNKK